MRFYEKALKAQRSIVNMERESMDPFKQLECEFHERLFTLQIHYYIGVHYCNERAYREAYLILQRVSQEIESVVEFAGKNNLQGQRVKQQLGEVEELMRRLPFIVCKCHAKVLEEEHQKYEKVQKEMLQMRVDEEKDVKQVKFDNVFDLVFKDSEGQLLKDGE